MARLMALRTAVRARSGASAKARVTAEAQRARQLSRQHFQLRLLVLRPRRLLPELADARPQGRHRGPIQHVLGSRARHRHPVVGDECQAMTENRCYVIYGPGGIGYEPPTFRSPLAFLRTWCAPAVE
jgi:hypothetical protein